MRRLLATLLTVLTLLPALGRPPVAQAQAGSGQVVRALLDALAQDDLDAAMALMVAEPELQTPEGELLQGAEAVRAYLAALPRPIEPGPVIPWGGHRVEAHLRAGETALVFLIEGASGAIAFIEVAPDDGSVVPLPPTLPAAGTGE
ncbi:MAG: hypothetical protein C4290_00745 [Chloroflexota bacterium]